MTMTMDYGTFLNLFSNCTAGFSQDFKKQFKRAKELYGDENYSAAMEAFRSLTIYDKANPIPSMQFLLRFVCSELGFNTMRRNAFANQNIYLSGISLMK